jgi:cyclase
MLTKRIIPCLDIQNGRTVKGVNFSNLRDAGNPLELAMTYAEQGADELVFLDISATNENRKVLTTLITEIARYLNIPFTVGGGISTVSDVAVLLEAGADKVSINSAAVNNPQLIDELSKEFGSQCIVLAIDSGNIEDQWTVYTNGGKQLSNKKLFSWATEGQYRGVGEILFTSVNHDGVKNGFAIDQISNLHEILDIPVIASGGAGKKEHFIDAFILGKADAVLAASVFHFGEIRIPELKSSLADRGIAIRL